MGGVLALKNRPGKVAERNHFGYGCAKVAMIEPGAMRGFVAFVVFCASIAAAACSESTAPSTPSVSDAGASDVDAGAACEPPAEAPEWLDAYLESRLGTLTAQPDRATPDRRRAAREWLRDELVALGIDATIESYGDGANVVGRMPAVNGETSEWILVGAHYDSVADSPGANDNGSGTVAVLAIARMAHELRCRGRGLVVAFFDQEEIGLVGSKALAAKEVEAGTNIVAVHTVDQVGWDGDGDRRFELELPTAELLAAYQASAEALGVTVVKTSTDGSDHQSFRAEGFAAIGITEEYVNRDTTPHAHAPADTASTIDRAYQALATRLVADVVARQLNPGR